MYIADKDKFLHCGNCDGVMCFYKQIPLSNGYASEKECKDCKGYKV